MKEEEIVKQYSDRIMAVVNSIRLLGEQFSEARIVEKVTSTLPERYEAKISSLEDSRDLTSISLTELINALYAQEQRRASKLEEHQERAFQEKTKLPRAPLPTKPKAEARVAEEGSDHEEQVFSISCSATKEKASKGWLIDSGCTNHMTPDAAIFKSIDRSFKTKVKVGNDHFIKKSLLSIAQLLEKGYSVVFKGKECQIDDPNGSRLMSVTMADKSFVVDWTNDLNSSYIASSDESKLWHQRLGHANF
ncbi:uncharacterized protein LOC128037716 [Gossypium raimondii]|uniref:uncharacterized protein LOC128037716 n=1 Tax=Gossypium raimondii TaxID=29730 RepID=UPI00227D0070|nr:uncharacterized protein LOC128037716 [Gossypium raimondii]